MTAHGSVEAAVEAMKTGAADFLQKPFSLDHLTTVINKVLNVQSLRAENQRLQEELDQRYQFDNIVGHSAAMREIFQTVTRVAPTRATVLLAGESGVGKDMIARAIHQHSPRKNRPFVKINCTALPENLMESELFGYEKGAFTGANVEQAGQVRTGGQGHGVSGRDRRRAGQHTGEAAASAAGAPVRAPGQQCDPQCGRARGGGYECGPARGARRRAIS